MVKIHPESLFIERPAPRIERGRYTPERPTESLPPQRLTVATISEHGLVANLYRVGGQWFRADGQPVYYTPESWRFLGDQR